MSMNASDHTPSAAMQGELISALADGQLQGEALQQALAQAASDPAQRWHHYHVIGDVLRAPELAPRRDPEWLLARLRPQLQQNQPAPAVATPVPAFIASPIATPVAVAPTTPRNAANAGLYRWRSLALAASVAVLTVIGTNLWQSSSSTGPQIAARTPAATEASATSSANAQALGPSETNLTTTAAGTMVRDPRLDQLLAAHRQAAGTSALQMPAGFLRNVTYEGAGGR